MRTLALALLIIATAAPAAQADAPAGWQRDALAVAQRVWHPACGQLSITFADPTDLGGDASWGGWAYLGECTIYEPTGYHWLGYPDFCSDVLHEAGHAAGFGHRPRGIMQASALISRASGWVVYRPGRRRHVVRWSGVDVRCLHRPARPYGL